MLSPFAAVEALAQMMSASSIPFSDLAKAQPTEEIPERSARGQPGRATARFAPPRMSPAEPVDQRQHGV